MLYAIVFATSLAGMLQAPWWAAVTGACLLALLFLSEQRKVAMPDNAAMSIDVATTASDIAISIGAAAAAFAFGKATAMMWGL